MIDERYKDIDPYGEEDWDNDDNTEKHEPWIIKSIYVKAEKNGTNEFYIMELVELLEYQVVLE